MRHVGPVRPGRRDRDPAAARGALPRAHGVHEHHDARYVLPPAAGRSRLRRPDGATHLRQRPRDVEGATWYDPPWSGYTAAHPWLPFGTHVRVTDLATGRSVTVVIDDRGPFAPGRVIDLSPEAFAALSPLGHGVLHVALGW
ncbi:MAG: hypothetical protein E6G54_02185 [Actinobacteria bacterium]|nr:MAG: hypothetical protein E6G54_02185 [Actinomycetota bacterium]